MADPATLTVMCTANQCRSPMAAALLRRALDQKGLDIEIRSAGFLPGGVPVPPQVLEVMGEIGIDLTEHRSRTVDEELVGASDLVVGMTRDHVIELSTQYPDDWDRIFTVTELVRRGRDAGPWAPDEPLRDWVRRASAERTRPELLSERLADDIADPMCGRLKDFRQTRDRLAQWADELADLLLGREAN